ncbi:MAG: family transcriptional regulator [Actinomycetia bacterium]|nr:family transcriptional regulator [Actinomycetes bacterium]
MPPRSQARSPENDPAALLGDELRELRKEAGYRSQDDVAAIVGSDRSVIGKAETGDQPPTHEVLTTLLDTYQVAGRLRRVYERLAIVARAREDPGRLRVTPWYETEAKAHTLRYWAPTIVPGIAQTRAYAAELYRALGHDEGTVAELIELRIARQAILTGDDPPDATILLWEPVLHHQIGTAETMSEQLAHLVELSSRVVIQIVPGSLGANAGLGGPIGLAASDDAPELLVIEALVEDQVTNNSVLVRKASATFSRVRGDALNVRESRTRLTEAMERWQS